MTKQWYAVHTYSGYEKKVQTTLDNGVAARGWQDRISQILIPTEDVAEIRDGKRRVTTKKIFPGYIMVEMDMEEDTWRLIKDTQGVTGFVGAGYPPVPLSEEEVENILRHMQETEETPRPRVVFEPGERVKVVEGPFENFSGYVAEINEERGRLKVMVDILGRSTAVELDFLQVEKI